MKVIFLDIDGVLNTSQTFIDIEEESARTGKERIEIDIERVALLQELVEKTGAVIVLTSSWRRYGKMVDGVYVPQNEKMKNFLEIFLKFGLHVYDITPKDKDGIKQNEIYAWLEGRQVESFVIFDDDSYSLQDFLHKELIKTSNTKDKEMVKNMDDCIGLCRIHVNEAIEKLNCPTIKR